jgi:tripartite-type tricarboxylate transporter receptor subunit TctC
MVPQLLGGQIDFGVTGMGSSTNNLRPLAVFSDTRLPFLPDVPTVAELGMPAIPPGYQGLFAPAGTPAAVVAALENACAEVVNSTAFRTFGAKVRQKVAYVNSAGFAQRAKADYEFKGKLIRELGIAAE